MLRKLSVAEYNDAGTENAKTKALFKSKPKTPADLVRQARDLLIIVDGGGGGGDAKESKRDEKIMELGKLVRDMKQVLYGDIESEPMAEACAQLTREFLRENTLRPLIICLPKLDLETRKDATQVIANLQRQQVQSRLIACDYLEKNIDLLDILILGFSPRLLEKVLISMESPSKASTKRDKSTLDATTNRINSLLFKVRSLRMSGSCALNLCGIAAGRLDLFYEVGFGGPWDVAAGALIVTEAGGLFFDPSGKDFDITSQRVAASNSYLKDDFIEALQQSEYRE